LGFGLRDLPRLELGFGELPRLGFGFRQLPRLELGIRLCFWLFGNGRWRRRLVWLLPLRLIPIFLYSRLLLLQSFRLRLVHIHVLPLRLTPSFLHPNGFLMD
jgi:hypothetical protein